MKWKGVAICLVSFIALSGCTVAQLKRGAYGAAYQKQCIDREGTTDCDPAHKSYEEYDREREEFLNREGKRD